MLDRKIPPQIKNIERIHLPLPETMTLSNGIPVYITNLGTQDVLKLQLVFKAGRQFEDKRMVARASTRLIKEGTKKHSSAEIAEKMDYYAATLGVPAGMDNANVVFFSMTKHFKRLLPLLTEILLTPSYPQKELNTYIENSRRRLQVDLSKNDVVAYRKITEYIFGANHPYGYNSEDQDYLGLTREDLFQHFHKYFNASNCIIFLSGKISPAILQLVEQYLGQLPKGEKYPLPTFSVNPAKPQKIRIPMPNSVQTSIRIGKQMINHNHPDFAAFTMLNTIFGGYFGSRLMTNIREDKGFTYGISSVHDTMMYDACFYVSTDVGNEFEDKAVKEIYKEIKKLQNDLVPAEELQMVRNYLTGNMLHMVDGPFNVSDLVKTIVLEELPMDSFDKLVQKMNQVTSEEIRDMAQKYLKKETFWEVRAGI